MDKGEEGCPGPTRGCTPHNVQTPVVAKYQYYNPHKPLMTYSVITVTTIFRL